MRISDWSSDVCSSDLLGVAQTTAILQFEIEAGGVAEFGDGGWCNRNDLRVTVGAEVMHHARRQRLHLVLVAGTLRPILETDKREARVLAAAAEVEAAEDRKSTRLNSSH